MARRQFEVIDIIEMLVHWHAGRNRTQIAQSLGIDRGTVAKYLTRAEAEGLTPGDQPRERAEWEALVRDWFLSWSIPGAAAGPTR